MARQAHSNELAPIPFGMDLEKYSWGGEIIKVKTFRLKGNDSTNGIWHIEKAQNSEYRLLDQGGRLILTGLVGQPVTIKDPVYGEIQLHISFLRGRVGAWFDLWLISKIAAIDTLSNQLNISEKGKNTGIIRMTLTGLNPERIKQVLDQVIISFYYLTKLERG